MTKNLTTGIRANFKVLTALALLLCAVTSSVEAANQTQALQAGQESIANLHSEATKHHSHKHKRHTGDPKKAAHHSLKKGRITKAERRPSLSTQVSIGDQRTGEDGEQDQAEKRTMSMIKEELQNSMEPEDQGQEYEEEQDPYSQVYQRASQYDQDRADRYLSSFNRQGSFSDNHHFMAQAQAQEDEAQQQEEEEDAPGERAAEKIYFRKRQAALQQQNAEIAAERAALKAHRQMTQAVSRRRADDSASILANELSDSIEEEDNNRGFHPSPMQSMAESDKSRGFGVDSQNTANIIANAIIHQKQQQAGVPAHIPEEEPDLPGSTFSERLKIATHSTREALEVTNNHPIISSLKEAHQEARQEPTQQAQKPEETYDPLPTLSHTDAVQKDAAVKRTLALMKGTPAEPEPVAPPKQPEVQAESFIHPTFSQPASAGPAAQPSTEEARQNAVQKTLQAMGLSPKAPIIDNELKQPLMPGPSPQAAPVASNPIEKKQNPFSVDVEAPFISKPSVQQQNAVQTKKEKAPAEDKDFDEPIVKIDTLPQGADVDAMLDVEARQHRAVARAQGDSEPTAPAQPKEELHEQKPQEPEPKPEAKPSLAEPAPEPAAPQHAEADGQYKNVVSRTLEALKNRDNEVAFPQPYIENKNSTRDPHAATDLEDLRKKTPAEPEPVVEKPMMADMRNATDPHAATNLEDLLSQKKTPPAASAGSSQEMSAVQKTLELIKQRQEPPKETPAAAPKQNRVDPPVPFLSASESKQAAEKKAEATKKPEPKDKDADSSNFKIVTSKLEVDDSMIKPVVHAEPEKPVAPVQHEAPKTLQKKVEKPKQEDKSFEIETTTMEADESTPAAAPAAPQKAAEVKKQEKKPAPFEKKKSPMKSKTEDPVSFKIETTVATPQMLKQLIGDNTPEEEEKPEPKAAPAPVAAPTATAEVKPIVRVLNKGDQSIIQNLKKEEEPKPAEPKPVEHVAEPVAEPAAKSAAKSTPKLAGLQNTHKAQDLSKQDHLEVVERKDNSEPAKKSKAEENQSMLPSDVFEAAVNNTLSQPTNATLQQKGSDIKIEDARKSHDSGLKSMIKGLVDTIQPALQEIQSKHKAKVQVVILDDNNSTISVPQAALEKMISTPSNNQSVAEPVAEPAKPTAEPAKLAAEPAKPVAEPAQAVQKQAPKNATAPSTVAQKEANKTSDGIDDQYLKAVQTTIEQTKQKEEAKHKDAVEKTLKLAKMKQEQEAKEVQEMLEKQALLKKQEEMQKKKEEEEAKQKAAEKEQQRTSIIQKTIELAKQIEAKEPKPEPKVQAKVVEPKIEEKAGSGGNYQNAIQATLNAIKANSAAAQPAPVVQPAPVEQAPSLAAASAEPKGQTNEEKAAELAAKLVGENPQNALKILEQKEEPHKSEVAAPAAPAAEPSTSIFQQPARPTVESVKNTIVQKTIAAIQEREERQKHPLSGLFKHFNVQTGLEETPLPPNSTAQVKNASKQALAAPAKNASAAQVKAENKSSLVKKPENKTALATPAANKTALAAPNKTSLAAPNKTALAAPNKTALAVPNKTSLVAPANKSSMAKKPENKTALAAPAANKSALASPNKSALAQPHENKSSHAQPSNKTALAAPSQNKTSVIQKSEKPKNQSALAAPAKNASAAQVKAKPENKTAMAAPAANKTALATPAANKTALAKKPENKTALAAPAKNTSAAQAKPENKSALAAPAANKTSLAQPQNKSSLTMKPENKTALAAPANKTSLAAPAVNKTTLATPAANKSALTKKPENKTALAAPANKTSLAAPAANKSALASPAANKTSLPQKAEKPQNKTTLTIKSAVQKIVNKSSLAAPKNQSSLVKTAPAKNASAVQIKAKPENKTAMTAPAANKTALAAPNKTALATPAANKTALSTPNKTALAAPAANKSALASPEANKTALAKKPENKTALASPKNSTALTAQPGKKENNSKLAQVVSPKSINQYGTTLKSNQILVQEDLEKQDAEALAEKQKMTAQKQLGKNQLRLEMQKEAHWLENSFAQMSHKMKSAFSNLFMAQKPNASLSNQDKMELFNEYLMIEEKDEDHDDFDE